MRETSGERLLILCKYIKSYWLKFFFQIFLIFFFVLDISMVCDGDMSSLLISPRKSFIFALCILRLFKQELYRLRIVIASW